MGQVNIDYSKFYGSKQKNIFEYLSRFLQPFSSPIKLWAVELFLRFYTQERKLRPLTKAHKLVSIISGLQPHNL